jgi:signal transduction histidine kinase
MGLQSRARPPRLPRHTVRFRLTALYSGLFLASGAALLAITYVLVNSSATAALFRDENGTMVAVDGQATFPSSGQSPQVSAGGPAAPRLARQLDALAAAQHAHDLHQLLTQSSVALAIMTVLAIVLGWLIAGRVLRPLRAMKAATQWITERNLHERLSLPGPDDEIKDLANTIDGLLARLESALEAQRRFVASASHELRTPLTLNRALLEVALADPDASTGDLRATCGELLAAGEHQERLIDALLTLASSERGLDRRELFDLAAATGRALVPHSHATEDRELEVDVRLGHAIVRGDPDLTERMAANLIDNAIRYNRPGGGVEVRTGTMFGHAGLHVANSGPAVPADEIGGLFQPFRRLADTSASHPDGHGLGLSIVRAIAAANGADLEARPGPDGGLAVTVRFPQDAETTDGARGVPLPCYRLWPAALMGVRRSHRAQRLGRRQARRSRRRVQPGDGADDQGSP